MNNQSFKIDLMADSRRSSLQRKSPSTVMKKPVLSPVKKRGPSHPWKYAEPLKITNEKPAAWHNIQPGVDAINDFVPIQQGIWYHCHN